MTGPANLYIKLQPSTNSRPIRISQNHHHLMMARLQILQWNVKAQLLPGINHDFFIDHREHFAFRKLFDPHSIPIQDIIIPLPAAEGHFFRNITCIFYNKMQHH